MATHFRFVLLVFTLLFTLPLHNTLIDANFGTKIDRPRIDDICNLTPSPHFCVVSLTTDPRTAGADISELLTIVLSQAVYRAGKISQFTAEYIPKDPRPQIRELLGICLSDINAALKYVRVAMIYSRSVPRPTNYSEIKNWALSGDRRVAHCLNIFPQYPWNERSDKVRKLVNVTATIIDQFLPH